MEIKSTCHNGFLTTENAQESAQGGAQGPDTGNHACSSATNAAQSASVFLLVSTATKPFALATTTGKPSKVDQNALDSTTDFLSFISSCMLVLVFLTNLVL